MRTGDEPVASAVTFTMSPLDVRSLVCVGRTYVDGPRTVSAACVLNPAAASVVNWLLKFGEFVPI